MAKSSIYSCDAPDCDNEDHKGIEVPADSDPRDFGVVTVTLDTKSIAPEDSVKHLVGDCEEAFMNGTFTGFELYDTDPTK